jgi:hypothetical protein
MILSDRPGLLLLCHGDLSDSAMADATCRRLYAECAEAYALMSSELLTMPGNDLLAGLNESIASFLSSESDGPVEQACLGFHRHGVREAMFRLLARGSRSIVSLGGAGLLLPGQGAAVHLPAAVGQVVADNAGLDVCCALPRANPSVTAGLVMASIERALTGRGPAPGPSWEAPRIGGDTGVLVVSAPDPAKALAARGRQSASYIAAAKRLSDNMQAVSTDSFTGITWHMSAVAQSLTGSGAFSAVRVGYLDFSAPDAEAAADGLERAGARQIIVSGMPASLNRHPLAWADTSDVIDRLKKKCAADIIYIKPDPQTCAPEIAAMLRMNVLEAAAAARQQQGFSPFS